MTEVDLMPMERAEEMGERLISFSDRCMALLQLLPRNQAGVANYRVQLSHCSTAAAAYYAEATDIGLRGDFAGNMGKALKEAEESQALLFIISKRGFFPVQCMMPLLEEVNDIVCTLGRMIFKSRMKILSGDTGIH